MSSGSEPTEVLVPAAAALKEGALLLARFRLERRIGVGGTADVWTARDERRDRLVTLKILRDRDDPEGRRRFLDEGLWLEAIEHPNVVRALGRHDVSGLTLIVFEHIEGETLADILARGPVPARRAMAIVRQIAGALDAIHAHGVVHLDLKPANVLVGADGRARLIDLGIADLLGGTREVVMGTPGYVAPEIRAGGAPTAQTDMYGLALIARELLGPIGQRPYVAMILRIALREDPRRRPASASRFARVLSLAVALAERAPVAWKLTRRASFAGVAVVLLLVALAIPRLASAVAGSATPRPTVAAERPPLSAYAARFEWQAPYPTVKPGAPVEWVVALRNTGTAPWQVEREGSRAVVALADGTVVGRPTSAVVAPGDVGIFLVRFNAPSQVGAHMVRMRLVVEGLGPTADLGLYAIVTVTASGR